MEGVGIVKSKLDANREVEAEAEVGVRLDSA